MAGRRRSARAFAVPVGCVAALSVVALLSSGCATDEGHLTLATTRDVSLASRDILDLDLDKLPSMRGIEGSSTAVTSVLFIPTFAGPSLADAVDDAIARGHGDLLTRAQVQTTKYWFLVGIETLTVRGNVIDLPESSE
jgi:hypothetical protein